MISYSDESQLAFAAFYQRYNDIDIYVEDRTLVGLYERAFSRILKGIANIISVTPLGNRSAVLREAQRLKNDNSRRRFFLVDGDFFWLFKKTRIKDLHCLNCYCFENLVFQHASIVDIALTLAPRKTNAEVINDFSISKIELIIDHFLPLFEMYCAAHILDSQHRTVSYAPDRLLHIRPNYLPDPRAIRNRIRHLYICLRLKHSADDIREALQDARSALTSHPDRSKFISGKYLLATLLRWFQAETEFRGRQSQLLSLLLLNPLLQWDATLARAVRRAARRPIAANTRQRSGAS